LLSLILIGAEEHLQLKTIDLSTRLWGITAEFVGFIPQSLVLRYIVLGLVIIYRNWSILSDKEIGTPLHFEAKLKTCGP